MYDPIVFKAMNTDFLLTGLPEQENASVRELVELAEITFSRFRPDSEISRLNAAGGKWLNITTLTYDLLSDAVEAYVSTGGLFSPFLANNLRALGYDRSFETLPPIEPIPWKSPTPSGENVVGDSSKDLAAAGPAPIEMDFELQRVRLLMDVAVDVGGIAKGWIAQQAANRLLVKGVKYGLIDAGGDVVLWGREPEQGVWGIGIAHPLGNEADIADLWLEGMTAIATSSIVKRRWQGPGGKLSHHIVDPRTGACAESDLLQATVLARDLTTAEQYAKCLIVLGSAGGVRWLAGRRPDLAYILVRRDGIILNSANISQYASEWKVNSYVELNPDNH